MAYLTRADPSCCPVPANIKQISNYLQQFQACRFLTCDYGDVLLPAGHQGEIRVFRQEGVWGGGVDRREEVELSESLDGLLDLGVGVARVLGLREERLDLLVAEALERHLALVAALGSNSIEFMEFLPLIETKTLVHCTADCLLNRHWDQRLSV